MYYINAPTLHLDGEEDWPKDGPTALLPPTLGTPLNDNYHVKIPLPFGLVPCPSLHVLNLHQANLWVGLKLHVGFQLLCIV